MLEVPQPSYKHGHTILTPPSPCPSLFSSRQAPTSLLTINRHPELRRTLRRAFTPFAATGLAGQTIGRGPAKGRPIQIDLGRDERRLAAGTYEPWVHSVLPDLLKPGMSMWDLGAHIGYCVIIAATLSPTGAHLAVEADPANPARLRHNLALNDIDAEVRQADDRKSASRPPASLGTSVLAPGQGLLRKLWRHDRTGPQRQRQLLRSQRVRG